METTDQKTTHGQDQSRGTETETEMGSSSHNFGISQQLMQKFEAIKMNQVNVSQKLAHLMEKNRKDGNTLCKPGECEPEAGTIIQKNGIFLTR